MNPLILALLTLFFWWRSVFLGQVLCFNDMNTYAHPWRHFSAEMLGLGALPLWNPYSSCGFPHHAFTEVALFYPFSLLFYALPFPTALATFLVLHFWLGGVAMCALMRRHGASDFGALVAAVAFAFNLWLISSVGFLGHFGSMVWVPLVFLLLDRAIEKPTLARGAALSCGLCIQYLGGYPEYCFYTWIALALFWLLSLTRHNPKSDPPYGGQNPKSATELLRMGLVFPSALVGVAVLVAIQLLPTLELVGQSARRWGVPFGLATEISLSPALLLSGLLCPFLFGPPGDEAIWSIYDFWLRSHYVSILALLFAPCAVFLLRGEKKTPRRLAVALLISLALFALIAMGRFTPVYGALCRVAPFFGSFRWPIKAIYLAVFCLAGLAGLGATALHADGSESTARRRIIAVAATALAMDLAFLFGASRFLRIVSPTDVPDLAGLCTEVGKQLLLINLGAAMIIAYLVRRLSTRFFQVAALGILIADLFYAGWRVHHFSSVNLYAVEPEPVQKLKGEKDLCRVFVPTNLPNLGYGATELEPFLRVRNTLMENIGVPYHVFSAYGDNSLAIERVREYFLRHVAQSPEPVRAKLLGLVNVKYVTGSELLPLPSFVPRAYVVPRVEHVPHREAGMALLKSAMFDPSQSAVIEGLSPLSFLTAPGPELRGREARLVKHAPHRVSCQPGPHARGLLVLADTFYPGWRGYVDGRRAPVLRVNHFQRAIGPLSGGETVEFAFQPQAFKLGCALTLAGLALLAGLCSILRPDLGLRRGRPWAR